MIITRAQRACLVAVRLADVQQRGMKRWLYRGLEEGAAREAKAVLDSHYGELMIRTGSQVDANTVPSMLASLAGRDEIEVVDLILVVHGDQDQLVFGQSRIDAPTFGRRIAHTGVSSQLRLVYSTACYGAQHNDDFLAAGFRAAIGAVRKNTNGLSEFRSLLASWSRGVPIAPALGAADRPAQRAVWDRLAMWFGGFSDVDSRKVLAGNGDLTIDSESVPADV